MQYCKIRPFHTELANVMIFLNVRNIGIVGASLNFSRILEELIKNIWLLNLLYESKHQKQAMHNGALLVSGVCFRTVIKWLFHQAIWKEEVKIVSV